MEQPTFTVVVPTFQRPDKISKCIESVRDQTFLADHKNVIEMIVVDDGSDPPTAQAVTAYQKALPWLVYVRQHRYQRLIARNKGMRMAKNDWIVWIDDDDEFYPKYFETFARMIIAKPQYVVHQCAVRFGKELDGVFKEYRILKPRSLKYIDFANNEETVQHDTKLKEEREHFVSGCITTGQFIFHRDCLKKTGLLPETNKYGDFAIDSGIPGYGWRPPEGRFKEKRVQVLGNPWGDDFYLFYKLTRFYNVNNTETVLLKKNCR